MRSPSRGSGAATGAVPVVVPRRNLVEAAEAVEEEERRPCLVVRGVVLGAVQAARGIGVAPVGSARCSAVMVVPGFGPGDSAVAVNLEAEAVGLVVQPRLLGALLWAAMGVEAREAHGAM